MDQARKPLHIVSAAVGEGAGDSGCKYAASALLASGMAQALADAGREVHAGTAVASDPLQASDRMDTIARFNHALAEAVLPLARGGAQLLVLGGDHSCAIGSWSGMAQALRPQGPLGLIWIDAHLDAHTPDSSESNAPHGMPLAALLGHGCAAFTQLFGWSGKIRPEHLFIIGARSYESAERILLDSLGVRVFFMEEVAREGFESCFAQAREKVGAECAGWGVSMDIDGLDPLDAPATGTPVAHGISLAEATAALRGCRDDPRFMGLEIVEYNPLHDFGGKTARAVRALAVAGLGQDGPAAGAAAATPGA
ncbi:arginase [Comamonas endophytica]|uniref:Arginase n=1 Tax=Comamonas endophytica TaxID=2949090 RepID=A0ABY6GGC4_9BURK|nr:MULTISPECIES: arginase [unclassified Acidovorax]MCD2513310.1 arginase [Acidovorax sp. D4N7]UYG53903.1 arginase [Acidovorax sp. 5MLIR]